MGVSLRGVAPLIACLALGAAARPVATPTGAEIVQAMHDRYVGKWFKTLTFVQTTTRTKKEGGDTVMTWYESASLPGKLRIDGGSPSLGNGTLYTHDSTYSMKGGALKQASAGSNPLIPLLFDVYVVPVDRTLADLRQLGIDVSKVHESTWDSRKVYVIGTTTDDEAAPSAWIDTERLVVLRQFFAVKPNDTTTILIDTQFSKYRPIGKSWIAPHCEFLRDGKRSQLEDYADIKADVPLSPALFDPAQWTTAPHWAH